MQNFLRERVKMSRLGMPAGAILDVILRCPPLMRRGIDQQRNQM
jgi:hypothetical protein